MFHLDQLRHVENKNVKTIVDHYKMGFVGELSCDKDALEDCIKAIEDINYSYYQLGVQQITDKEYDKLVLFIKESIPELYLKMSVYGADETNEGLSGNDTDVKQLTKAMLKAHKMYSISPAFSREEATAFVQQLPPHTILTADIKMDGLGAAITYSYGNHELALSRGRTSEPLDFTEASKHTCIPKVLDHPLVSKARIFNVRVEYTLPFDNFNKLVEMNPHNEYSNPRNSTVSVLYNSNATPEESALAVPYALNFFTDSEEINEIYNTAKKRKVLLKELGFNIPPAMSIDVDANIDEFEDRTTARLSVLDTIVATLGEDKHTLGVLSDGVVVVVNDDVVFEEMGVYNEKYQLGACALKYGAWENLVYRGYISKDNPYDMTSGTTKHTLTALLDPPTYTEDGKKITRIPLGGLHRLIYAKAFPGHPIDFEYVSGMMPKLLLYTTDDNELIDDEEELTPEQYDELLKEAGLSDKQKRQTSSVDITDALRSGSFKPVASRVASERLTSYVNSVTENDASDELNPDNW